MMFTNKKAFLGFSSRKSVVQNSSRLSVLNKLGDEVQNILSTLQAKREGRIDVNSADSSLFQFRDFFIRELDKNRPTLGESFSNTVIRMLSLVSSSEQFEKVYNDIWTLLVREEDNEKNGISGRRVAA